MKICDFAGERGSFSCTGRSAAPGWKDGQGHAPTTAPRTAAVTPAHLRRGAIVYLRQSSRAQLVRHRSSTALQYALMGVAEALGWAREEIEVIDSDLGVSGAGFAPRCGFARLLAETSAARVGLVLAADASRFARNGGDWHTLIELCAATDTLVGDTDAIYRPAVIGDRLLLLQKAVLSEVERHWLQARLAGGIRHKASCGTLRWRLPIGFVWGPSGQICLHPDPGVRAAIRAVFERFATLGSARRVWLSFRAEDRLFPQAVCGNATIRWVAPGFAAIRGVLGNPAYAGAYAYGRRRREVYADREGRLRHRTRSLPREEWAVLIREHHRGYIGWTTWQANQDRLAQRATASPIGARSALGGGREAPAFAGARPRSHARTDLATVALVRQLAADYPDSLIAAVLDHKQRRTPGGHRFTGRRVGDLRRHWQIPSYARPKAASLPRLPVAMTCFFEKLPVA